ncbi:MAG TPA: [FeFe] hydrogenase H-cluster maturation GTPase HydF, partial [Candidatus Mediterraneibacter stercoravium]|nr:[FeFe] hydrogenase H-cluster maturation GTPase HydF [Candidatus Mediterraneibacter stercoravium]
MSMNQTPMSERVHIGFFGKRNAGKSSVMNAVTGQEIAVVSDVRGTTTDPVYKSMELLPLGPVIMMDTPGIDDEGELGALRVRKSYQVLNKTDAAVLVIDGAEGVSKEDSELVARIRRKKIPFLVAVNKRDIAPEGAVHRVREELGLDDSQIVAVSASDGTGINELKERIARTARTEETQKYIVRDIILPSDFVVLVVPIDKAAPKGRLILPQQQTIRDILDGDAVSIVVKDCELKETLQKLGKKPKLVITDSQAFSKVSADTPDDILLTSFSILFARYKGNLETAVRGVTAVDGLRDGDVVLISEGCTHHRQCDDIGTVKIPRWIREYTGKKVQFETTSGTEFPDDLSRYRMVIHCGGC